MACSSTHRLAINQMAIKRPACEESPYVIRSLQEMERANFGHPLPELGGRRGRFSIREVYAYHPLTGERQLLWEKGSTRPQKPQIWVTPGDVSAYAEQLPSDHVTLEFLSP